MASLVEAVSSGNRRKSFIALRDKLASTIENCESGRDMAALSRRLIEVMNEIDQMPDESREQTKFERLQSKAIGG